MNVESRPLSRDIPIVIIALIVVGLIIILVVGVGSVAVAIIVLAALLLGHLRSVLKFYYCRRD